MESKILDDVKTYLSNEVSDADDPILLIFINRAIRKVCNKRYPFGYTDSQKIAAVEKYQDVIFEATVYYWAKQGADGENSHSENGISRSYQCEDDIYFDIVPMVKIL